MVKEKLIDEESRILYELRSSYYKTEDYVLFMRKMLTLNKKWFVLDPCFQKIEQAVKLKKEIIIYGCGMYGIHTKFALEACGINIDYFCDSNADLQGTMREKVKIISPQMLVEKHSESLVIVSMKNHWEEIYRMLLEVGFSEESIVIPENGILVAFCGWQYFDMFKPDENEVFVDAGAYDGQTVLEFLKWTNKRYSSIYALEPFEAVKPILNEKLRGVENLNIIYKAAWNKEETLLFGGDPKAFEINGGNTAVSGGMIDDIVGDDKVTFIKMDIEGSEYQALLGAENTIKNNKPKLAISIYHKPEDIVKIPDLIEKMVPEYKFAIRHYTMGLIETVLYAWV